MLLRNKGLIRFVNQIFFRSFVSDADLEERTRIERQEIVARYDLGRDEGAKIDDWEDPKLEVYHKQDRWGFIQ